MLVKLIAKYGWILLVDILLVWFTILAGTYGELYVALASTFIMLLFNYVFIKKATYPYRYLFPGLLCFFLFMVFPISFTVYIAFTNLGTGHILSHDNAKQMILSEKYVSQEENVYFLDLAKKGDDFLLSLKEDVTGQNYWAMIPEDSWGNGPVSLNRTNETFDRLAADNGARVLTKREVYQAKKILSEITVQLPDGKQLNASGVRQFAKVNARYTEVGENIIDTTTNEVFRPDMDRGVYVGDDSLLLPGFTVGVGLSNFTKLFNNPQIAKPFLKVFAWTFGWAFFTVVLTFAMGMTLALILNTKKMRMRSAYRMLLIIPYSIPFFISVLIFRGMYNKDFGIINEIIGYPIPWLEHPMLAKMSCLLVNLWLGFPYMLLVLTGILQSIPADVYEAARIDGASRWTQFSKITMPMVMSAVAPLLVGSFAFNFNNFVGIYLLTGGLPPMQGVSTPAGETDILISYTYRLAFEGGQGQDFGLASAIAVLIFVVIAILTMINFKYSGVLKKKRV